MNGDKAEINFEDAKRKKLRYEDYEEGSSIEGAFDFGKHIEEIENVAFEKVEEANTKASEAEGKVSEYEAKVSEFETAKNEIEEKYNQISAEFEEMKPKYEDFVKAEQARIEAELDAQKDAEIAKYEAVLADDVNFAELKEKKSEKTVKEIESECAIMYARKTLAQTNFSKSNDGVMTAGLIDNGGKDGFVETKYGYIPVR
jgi:DNA repair exonuclease SbcCD ATPase subunit